jgi:hypothetical protein
MILSRYVCWAFDMCLHRTDLKTRFSLLKDKGTVDNVDIRVKSGNRLLILLCLQEQSLLAMDMDVKFLLRDISSSVNNAVDVVPPECWANSSSYFILRRGM